MVSGTQADAGSGFTRAQIREAKQTAAGYFRHRGNICNNGQNIKIRTLSNNWPARWASVDSEYSNGTGGLGNHSFAHAYINAGKPGAPANR